jgi:hypothetical protein
MDFETIIIGTILLAVFIVPVIYLMTKQKKKAGRAIRDLLVLGEQQQLRLTKYDFWEPGLAIGLDEGQRKLLYLQKQDEILKQTLIDLAEVKSCTVANMHHDANGNRIIEEVALHIAFRDSKRAMQPLVFYNRQWNMLPNVELRLAEKWSDSINTALEATRQPV